MTVGPRRAITGLLVFHCAADAISPILPACGVSHSDVTLRLSSRPPPLLSELHRRQGLKTPPKKWVAGVYSFSDELGGFTITGVSGTGSKDDPIVITEELNSASPVTLVIRATTVMHPFTLGGDAQTGFTHMRFVTLNNSGLAWVEFEFELQEIKDVPSTFGDGLSFDQRRSETEEIVSDRFAKFSRDFEPYDRLRFLDGKVDPLDSFVVQLPRHRLHPALAILYRPGSAHPVLVSALHDSAGLRIG